MDPRTRAQATPRLYSGTGDDIGGKTDHAALLVAHQRPPFWIRSRSGASVLQRKLLQPNHFRSLDELQQAILDFITRYNQTAKPLQWSYTVEQLEQKLAMRLGGT